MFDTNSGSILRGSYSMLAFYALAAVTLAPDLIYLIWGIDTNPKVWSALQLWVIFLGIFGRLVMQTKETALRRHLIFGLIILATLLAAAQAIAQTTDRQTMKVLVPLVMKWEGEHRCKDDPSMHCAYLDIVGVPTDCYGETRGVKLGDRSTDAQCRQKLERRLLDDFLKGLRSYFTDDTEAFRLTPHREAAYGSLAYNVGWRGAGRSTATRRLNAGDIAGGCAAIAWWNKAGGRVVRGLVNRRAEEVALCRIGL